ncbi:MAG TPA: hypothetical protein VGJ84_03230, partial [Polyangiaceae bacterium]
LNIGVLAPTTASNRGTPISNGEQGASISCTISGSGTFSIRAETFAQENNSSFNIQSASVPAGGVGMGEIDMQSVSTGHLQTPRAGMASSPCSFDVSVSGTEVGAGKVYAKVTCPKVLDPQTPTNVCRLDGWVLLEGCGS